MTSLESYFQDGDPNSWALVVDSSSHKGSLIAVNKNLKILYSGYWDKKKKHTDVLLEEFTKLKNEISLKKMALICFINGPGSFTGLRVGASFVKALSFANEKTPIVAVSSFWPVANEVVQQNPSLKRFSICLPSIGLKFFRSDFELQENMSWNEKINLQGAEESLIYKEQNFSPDPVLSEKNTDIQHIDVSQQNLVESLKSLDRQDTYFKAFTYLDLYPLYLRKSEAEEKYSYDKIKL